MFLNWNCEMPNFVQNKPHWHHITSMIWSSVKKNSFLWRNGSKVKIWGAICLWINVNVLMNWKCEKASIAHSFDSDDCPYDRLVISKIKKTFIWKMSKRPCSQYPNLSTACQQTYNHKSWKELWLFWTRFGPCLSAGPAAQSKRVTLDFLNKIWSISWTVCHAWAGLSGLSRVRLMQEFHQWRVVASAPTCPMLVRRPYCTA